MALRFRELPKFDSPLSLPPNDTILQNTLEGLAKPFRACHAQEVLQYEYVPIHGPPA